MVPGLCLGWLWSLEPAVVGHCQSAELPLAVALGVPWLSLRFGNWARLTGLGWLMDETTLDLPCGWWYPGSFLPQSLEVGIQLDMELW